MTNAPPHNGKIAMRHDYEAAAKLAGKMRFAKPVFGSDYRKLRVPVN